LAWQPTKPLFDLHENHTLDILSVPTGVAANDSNYGRLQ
jgi:hypothetical protein